jgi:hypothetical protein
MVISVAAGEYSPGHGRVIQVMVHGKPGLRAAVITVPALRSSVSFATRIKGSSYLLPSPNIDHYNNFNPGFPVNNMKTAPN